MAKTKTDSFTKLSLAASPMIMGDAGVFAHWPGSLPERTEEQVLHYWGPWDKLVKPLADKFRPSGPGHQYVIYPDTPALLKGAAELIEEVRRTAGKVVVRPWRGSGDVNAQLVDAIAAGRDGEHGRMQRGLALLEERIEVVAKAGILSLESVPADAYRRLEVEMGPSPLRAEGALWKKIDEGPLLAFRPGDTLQIAAEPDGSGVLMAEHNWDDRAKAAPVLQEARSSANREHIVGSMTVPSGLVVMAKAAVSHHLLVPGAKNPVEAFRALLAGGAVTDLKIPKLGKVGSLVAVPRGSYEVLLGATDKVRWCRLRMKRKS
jgi:hypothetical protein